LTVRSVHVSVDATISPPSPCLIGSLML